MLGRPGEYDRLNEHTLRRLVAARAREAARQRKLTQADVAEELGVSRATLSNWLQKLKNNNMVYEPRHNPPSVYDGVVEAQLRRLAVQEEQGEGGGEGEKEQEADAIDCTQAAFILGVNYDCMYHRLRSFKRSKGRYTPLSTTAISRVLKSLASASSSHSETYASCNMADDGDCLHTPYMRTRRKRHGSYNDDDHGDDDSYDDRHDDDDDDDDGGDDDDDELCRRLAYQPNCTLPAVVDDRIPTRTEHHIRIMYRGYLQLVLGRPGEYDRLNEHTLRRLVAARAREAARQRLTQADVAEVLGVGQRTIRNWLRKLKNNNMVYEPRYDPPSEYDVMVEARLRRLTEQEQEEGVADAIDCTQAAFILGVSYNCMNSRLHRFQLSKGRYTPLGTAAINNVLESLRLAGASSCPQTDDALSMADDGFVQALGKRKRRERHDVDHHRESPDLEAQNDDEDNSPAAQAPSALEAALLLS
jgi:transcriptional regulator with XRE-family HTH domain